MKMGNMRDCKNIDYYLVNFSSFFLLSENKQTIKSIFLFLNDSHESSSILTSKSAHFDLFEIN